jgi:DeoR/GlpR family transcriptional regulator of sugar metabolism
VLIAERRRRIIEQVQVRGYASFRELADALNTSESTMRRDLRSMIADGLLTPTRGGVSMPELSEPGAHRTPRPGSSAGSWAGSWAGPDGDDGEADELHPARLAIATHAAGLVRAGTGVLIGPGRTTAALARCLTNVPDLTVVTNSLPVVAALSDAPSVDVVMVGGALRRSINAFVGPITEQILVGLRGAQVFLSGDGVTVERGLTTPNVFAAAADQALAQAGHTVVVLADHSKLGRDTMCQTVPTERIDILVTDDAADESQLRRLRDAHVDVRQATRA